MANSGSYPSKLLPPKKYAALPIDFLVVGGGIAGLASAIALTRIGHRVTVLERDATVDHETGGCRMTPNLSKILFHWGLEEDVRRIGVKSTGVELNLYETGETLGTHVWDYEMLQETRGEFIFTTHAQLRKLLYDVAIANGAKVRLGAEVTGIDPEQGRVKLSTGEVLTGDVIVGADGAKGITRPLVVEEGEDDTPNHHSNYYASIIPRGLIAQDPDLSCFLEEKRSSQLHVWFGNNRAALAYPVAAENTDWAMIAYTLKDGNEGWWNTESSSTAMAACCTEAEARLQKLSKLSSQPPVCVPVLEYRELEEWVHDSGRLIVLGDAAHPMPPGGIQAAAMAFEDGAVLAKLFSHIRTSDQIPTLLYAYQDLRQPHVRRVQQKELADLYYQTMPPGEVQQGRDEFMRTQRDAGRSPLAPLSEDEELPEWTEMKDVFGYDAEDDADNWWVEWGLLRERARGTDVKLGFVEPVAIRQGRMSVSEELAA
ncbi:hypothetical protein NMY22_g7250 [Coprinellus aureogranulatus]|nr:hypothetical protein NMY22_g7250 [Coprinellus aureogranulatus]